MKKKGKTRLIHARLLEHEKLDAIMDFFQARYRAVFGKQSKRHVPVALALDFALDVTGELVTNPDLFIASESGTLAHLNKQLMDAIESNTTKILEGVGVNFEVTRTEDGGIYWNAERVGGGGQRAAIRVGPEVFKSARDGGELRRKFASPERDFSIH